MWRKLKRSVKKVYKKIVKSKTKRKSKDSEESEDNESQINLKSVLKFSANDMQIQIDGNWVSKCVIQSIDAKQSEDKLLKLCRQSEAYRLESVITKDLHNRMEVLSSGCYSEVLKVKGLKGEDVIFKISLIDRVNKSGVVIQTASSILTDVINAKLLSDLKSIPVESANNYCENFGNISNFYYVWSNCLAFNGSEVKQPNDKKCQKYHYFISQQSFGGKELNSITGLSPTKGLSVVLQLIASLAVAEEAIQFEHRDLHTSNILVNQSEQKYAVYVINGQKFYIELNGIKLVVIDTTFSRSQIKFAVNSDEEVVKCIYNDLSSLDLKGYPNSELKKVYEKQSDITSNKWRLFCPKTNIIWMSYCVNTVCHKVDKWCEKRSIGAQSTYGQHLLQLRNIQKIICDSNSAKHFAKIISIVVYSYGIL